MRRAQAFRTAHFSSQMMLDWLSISVQHLLLAMGNITVHAVDVASLVVNDAKTEQVLTRKVSS